MIIRLRYIKLGGHIHCRLFTAPANDQTFAKCGELVFDEREWPDVSRQLASGGVQIVPDGERVR